MTRVAVADLGSNSTRLLVGEPAADGSGTVRELARASTVTRLAEGVEATGSLAPAAQRRVLDVLERYRETADVHAASRRVAMLTSAVRDARDGEAFAARVDALGFAPQILTGEQEARLTYAGATAGREPGPGTLVADIGGGSTELVGAGLLADGRVTAADVGAVSLQVGVVRHAERHLHHDPPRPEELAALAEDARTAVAAALAPAQHDRVDALIAVAGTPTQCAALDLGLERYDAAAIEGHRLTADRLAALRDRLAPLDVAALRAVPGLHPQRAPVLVPGIVVLLVLMEALALDAVTVSEHDLLWGTVLAEAGRRAAPPAVSTDA